MNVKIDTKEKFTVITPNEPEISANMTEELINLLQCYPNKQIPHVILNMENVNAISNESGKHLISLVQQFTVNGSSFVICRVNKVIEKMWLDDDTLHSLNITPTESEAWDILQMEEIERELMKDFDNDED